MDLISRQTRLAFREHLVGWTLRTITDLFDAADIPHVSMPQESLPSGMRRSLVEEYYAGVDWSSARDVRKVLRVYEDILAELDPESRDHEKLSNLLGRDGYVYQDGHLLSGGPVELAKVEDASQLVDRRAIGDHLRRIEESVDSDPAQAVGSAKELVETVSKLVLEHYSENPDRYDTVQQLVKAAIRHLDLSQEDLPETRRGADSMRQVLAGVAQVVGGIAELRNLYGTGHGQARPAALQARHARLVVGSASTICMFLLETLDARKRKEHRTGAPSTDR